MDEYGTAHRTAHRLHGSSPLHAAAHSQCTWRASGGHEDGPCFRERFGSQRVLLPPTHHLLSELQSLTANPALGLSPAQNSTAQRHGVYPILRRYMLYLVAKGFLYRQQVLCYPIMEGDFRIPMTIVQTGSPNGWVGGYPRITRPRDTHMDVQRHTDAAGTAGTAGTGI